jgi:hypothetical protein
MREDGSFTHEGRKERREKNTTTIFPHSSSSIHAYVAFKFFFLF